MIDSGSGISTTYYYDFIDRLAKYTEKGTDYSHSVEYGFDSKNNLSALKETINGITRETGYTYDADSRLETITNDSNTIVYTYDDFGRVEKQEVKNGTEVVLTTTYTYRNPKTTTTSTQISSIQHTAENYSVTYTYTYDGNGNILSISDGTNAITYEYDTRDQLIRENDPIAGISREYQYRDGGQLYYEVEKPYTTGDLSWSIPTVQYTGDSSWGDMLTAVNGQSITRDAIGNMLSYNGYTYTWEHGRELATMSKSGDTWTFTYDANGMRTKRVKTNTSGAVTDTYTYVYNGSQLSQMTKNGQTLNFFYDGEGRPAYFTYNNTTYYYVTNLQGDVVAILDSTGTVVVNYHYDAYGVLLQTGGAMADSLGKLNPLTYRGYVYDHETGLYYLQSRYYNPNIRQFISTDAYISTGQGILGYNMFAYCGNNPVNRADPNGEGWITALIITVIAAYGGILSGSSPQHEPYESADEAAKAFSESVYSSSSYIRHEVGTEIYSRTINGKTTYNYNTPRAGNPHSVTVGQSTPIGTEFVAYAHTHPNSNAFSSADISAARSLGVDAYMVGPNLELQRYSLSSDATASLGTISPITLTDWQCTALVMLFQISWDSHVAKDCAFGCESMMWPTP